MNVGFDSELEGISGAESAKAWLRRLSDDPGARLDAIHAWLGKLTESAGAARRPAPHALIDILEVLRVEQWRAVVARLEPLAGRPVPFTPIEWPLLHSALASLRTLRNLYKRLHAQTLRAGEASGRIPGARESMTGVLPLVRALDAQARVVVLLLRHRCVPQAEDWDELCVLARNVRRSSFQDEALSDEVPLVKPTTARALFVYPLLLECAWLAARMGAEADLARRIAARLASRVGYRIDRGAPRDNEHGPRVALTAEHAVRLDTHRVPAALAKWRGQWFGDGEATKASALPVPLPEADAMRLFDDLERCWAPAATPRSTGAHPAACAASQEIRLRFGLPKTHAADFRPAAGPASPRGPGASGSAGGANGDATGTGDARYEYGRWEQNTIIRLAFGSASPGPAATANWIGDSELATRLVDRPDGRTVIARESSIPRSAVGTLVAIEHEAETPADRAVFSVAAPQPHRSIALGNVEAIEQLPGRDGHASRAHWLIVRPWAGQAIAVGVRVGESVFFEDAWLLRGLGASCELPCLVMAPGRARGGDPGVLREPGGEVAIRFVTVLDRGVGYERLSMRTESARGAC
ncbi:MAG TPA: hypothetical protein VGE10_07975 [Zeimonas sp.]